MTWTAGSDGSGFDDRFLSGDEAQAALPSRRAPRTGFLTRYRAHALDHHGKFEPPDFERRRRLPVAGIHFPAATREEHYPERMRLTPDAQPFRIPGLRANPLPLSLPCILCRGEGYGIVTIAQALDMPGALTPVPQRQRMP
jgi:hypothetical protein